MNKVFVCGDSDFIKGIKDELNTRYDINCNTFNISNHTIYQHIEILLKQVEEASCMIVQCSTLRDIGYFLIGYAKGCRTFLVGIDDGESIPNMREIYDVFNLLFEDADDVISIIEDIA